MFMPHGMCFLWQRDILTLHVVSDALIGLAYFCIPALIIVYVRRRRALWRVASFFSTFIISCGSTHIADIWTIWHPDYWVSGALKAVTAVASLATVVSLLPVMPYARGLRRILDIDRISGELEEQSQLHRETRQILDTIAQIISIRREDLSVEYLSPQWYDYTGAPAMLGPGAKWREYVHPDDIMTLHAELLRVTESQPPTAEYELRLRGRDGAYRWFLVRTVPLPPTPGSPRRWLTTSTDIDEIKRIQRALSQAAADLEHIAHHDPVTDLPNRRRLTEELERAIAVARRDNAGLIVMYVDLDGFKAINDSLGHANGDIVLTQAASRIAQVLRTGDLACRIGGDEFVLVCATSEGAEHAARIAERLLASIAEPMRISGRVISVSASVGISLFPRDGDDVESLLRKADTAMYAAKEAGANRYRLFGETSQSELVAGLEFEAELREAILQNQFEIHYQPIVSLPTQRVIGAEALVRWRHPHRGLLAPAEFVPVAERINVISQLTQIVIAAACEQLSRFPTAGDDAFVISVNVSPKAFETVGLIDTAGSALQLHKIERGRLEIEITENLFMSDTSKVLESLKAMEELGLRLSIDDFGTGYCSLSYLRIFSLHTLKIDRFFVDNIEHSRTDQAIARAIISLAHTMGLSVIAEGVESVGQMAQLRAIGCDCIQGFLISPPLPQMAFEQFVAEFEGAGSQQHALPERLNR